MMATRGDAFYDAKGNCFRTADEATCSDLAAALGRTGDGDSLAQGIAKTMLEKRAEIERIFADHDSMIAGRTLDGVTHDGVPV
jgi:hypothetical protein